MKIGITTTQRKEPYPHLKEFLQEAGLPFYPRNGGSVARLMREHDLAGMIVWKENGPELHLKDADQPFFYHPSMAKNRLTAWRKKQQPDALARAAELRPGDAFLDCTLGMGADALTAAYFTEEAGRVVGVESSPLIALIIRWGMRIYAETTEHLWMRPALSRIEVVNADYLDYLRALPDDSFDVVYFDPMFRQPVYESQAISVIRSLANPAPLSPEAVQEACRVARRCVLLKEKQISGEFERLGFTPVHESQTSKLAYGRIEVKP